MVLCNMMRDLDEKNGEGYVVFGFGGGWLYEEDKKWRVVVQSGRFTLMQEGWSVDVGRSTTT